MSDWTGKLGYFVEDAWDEWRHSPGVNLLAAATLASSLLIAGLVALMLVNVGRQVQVLRADLRVEVFLVDGAEPAVRHAMRERLEAVPGVARVDYVNKQQALERYRRIDRTLGELAAELDNPLPASFDVYLTPGPEAAAAAERVLEAVSGDPLVEESRFDQPWLERLDAGLRVARVAGTVLGVAVFLAVVFVMGSVLRLAVYARRDEIEIMQLVGATPAFIRGPFLVAGFAQGLLASLLAVVLVEIVRRVIVGRAAETSAALVEIVAGSPLPASVALLLVLAGLVVSLAGAFFAVWRSI